MSSLLKEEYEEEEEEEEELRSPSIPLPKFRLEKDDEIPNSLKDLFLNSKNRINDKDEQIFLTGTTAMPYNYRPNRVRRSACSDLQSTTIPEGRIYNDQYDNNRRRSSLFASPSLCSPPPIHTSSSSSTIDENDDYVNLCRKRCQSLYGATKTPYENLVRQIPLSYGIITPTNHNLESKTIHTDTGVTVNSCSYLMPQSFFRRHSHCLTPTVYDNEPVTEDPYISSTSLIVEQMPDNDDVDNYSRSSSCFDVNEDQQGQNNLFQPKSKKKSCSDTNILHQTRHSLPCENSNTSLAIKNFLKRHHLSLSKTPTTSSSSLVSSTNSLSSSSLPLNSTFQNFKHFLTLVKLPKQQRSSVSSSASSTASVTPTHSSLQTLTTGSEHTSTSLTSSTTPDTENESTTISKNSQKKSTTKLKMCDCEWHYQ
ncbi:unnamed protein product, partial [Didymodactylos carnosus]